MRDFEWYHATYQAEVLRFALRLTKNRQDAEDLTQEAFYRAFRRFAAYDGERPFKNWMFSIVQRLFFDSIRKANSRPRTVSFDHPIPGTDLCFDAPTSWDPASGFLASEFGEALEGLSRPVREALELVVLQDASVSEASEVLNVSCGTIRTRLFRARQRLAAQLSS